MKRIIIIILALLCVFTFMSCKQDPEEPEKTPDVQTVKTNKTQKPTGCWNFQSAEAKYCLYFDGRNTTAELEVKMYDKIKNEWPAEYQKYTGTYSMEKYGKVITDTASYKEITETWMVTVAFDKVQTYNPDTEEFENDPWYESMTHVYDGVFDVKYLSNYGSLETPSGGYDAKKQYNPDTVVAFEVSMNSDGAPCALIGVGNWTYGAIDL